MSTIVQYATKSRASRKFYWWSIPITISALIATGFAMRLILNLLPEPFSAYLAGALAWTAFIIAGASHLLITAARCRDAGIRGYWALMNLISPIALILATQFAFISLWLAIIGLGIAALPIIINGAGRSVSQDQEQPGENGAP